MSVPNCFYKYFNQQNEVVVRGQSSIWSSTPIGPSDRGEVRNEALSALFNICIDVRDGRIKQEIAQSIASIAVDDQQPVTLDELVKHINSGKAKNGSLNYPPVDEALKHITQIFPHIKKQGFFENLRRKLSF